MNKKIRYLAYLGLLLLGCKGSHKITDVAKEEDSSQIVGELIYSSDILVTSINEMKNITVYQQDIQELDVFKDVIEVGSKIRSDKREILGVEVRERDKSKIYLKNGEIVETSYPPISTLVSGDLNTVIKFGPDVPEYYSVSSIQFYNKGKKQRQYDSIDMFKRCALSENGYLATEQGEYGKRFGVLFFYSPKGEIIWSKTGENGKYVSVLAVSDNGDYVAMTERDFKDDNYEFLKVFNKSGNKVLFKQTGGVNILGFSESSEYLLASGGGRLILFNLHEKKAVFESSNFLYRDIPQCYYILEKQNLIITGKLFNKYSTPNNTYNISIDFYSLDTGEKLKSIELPGIHSFIGKGGGFLYNSENKIEFQTDQDNFQLIIN